MLGRWAVFRITCTLIVNMSGMSLVISINEYTFFFFFHYLSFIVTKINNIFDFSIFAIFHLCFIFHFSIFAIFHLRFIFDFSIFAIFQSLILSSALVCKFHFGVYLDSKMSFDKQVSETCKACYFHIRALHYIRASLTTDAFKTM